MKNETILFFFIRLVYFFGLIENVLIILQCNAKQKGIEISSKRKAKRKTYNKKKYRKQAENFAKRKFSFSFQKISY